MFRRGRAAALVVTAATALALATGSTVSAADETPAAAHAVVLTIIPEIPEEADSVTLECDPDGGTHPNPAAACRSLTAVKGDFYALPSTGVPCPDVVDPVRVVAWGSWNGTTFSYEEIFINRCAAAVETDDVFRF